MNFISVEFIVFFPLVVLIYWILPGKYRWIFLLGVSGFFYFYESHWAGLFLVLTAAVTYGAAVRIGKGRKRQLWLAGAVLFCLGLLIGLKYAVPPVGLSFYTFQTLSYVLDVYAGNLQPERNFGRYALFVSFFPQLVAGPVERCGALLPQLNGIHRFRRRHLAEGAWLMLRGFFKKIVIADQLAPYVDGVYAASGDCGGMAAVLGTVFFAVQIYCDFSGYTDIARGSARMLGIHLMENFRHPYQAGSIREFWHRWHISLTGWFTDYVYLPLGGSRKGLVRQCVNTWIVFGLSGFWHGASWNFVIWGLLHGCFLSGEILLKRVIPRKSRGTLGTVASRAGTLALVCVAWIFFRSPDPASAVEMLGQIFTSPFGADAAAVLGISGRWEMLKLFVILLSFWLIEQMPDSFEEKWKKPSFQALAAVAGVAMLAAVEFFWLGEMARGAGNTFIYFRF